MIAVLSRQIDLQAAKLVTASLRRSVSAGQAKYISPAEFLNQLSLFDMVVVIRPDDYLVMMIERFVATGKKKVIVLGAPSASLQSLLPIRPGVWPEALSDWSSSLPAPIADYRVSAANVEYRENHDLTGRGCWDRPFERFDFADEWNNLGYGAIRMCGDIWSLDAPLVVAAEYSLADVMVEGEAICSYAALRDNTDVSILWFNRAVGPIDSFEWHLVERFIAVWRHDELPVLPVLLDLPWGYDAAVTMRLDCDEDIQSAQHLWRGYQEEQVPFSLAVHAGNLHDTRHDDVMREMLAQGVAFLSHSLTHAPNWGGSYDAARHEASASAQDIARVLQHPVHYAVSPFHKSPDYALHALCDAGYQGVIGGIICNDPEFLLARGGEIADMPEGFIGHSQQVMLHGDCLLEGDDPLAIYKQSFELFYRSKMLFGYLDHPFSERYQYGWQSEEQRLDVHRQLITWIRERAASVIFLSENDAMDFILDKTRIRIHKCNVGFEIMSTGKKQSHLQPTLLFADGQYSAESGTLMR